jgi:hypothetical protein
MDKHLQTFFDVIDTEEKAYWLGFIAADGYVMPNKSVIGITLSIKDNNHLNKLAKIFNMVCKERATVHNVTKKEQISSYMYLCSKHMVSSLDSKGIQRNKTDNLDDSVFSSIPEHLLHHFIRGYFDGDGHITNKKEIRFVLAGTEKMLTKIRDILAINCGINENSYVKKVKGCYILRYAGSYQLIKIRDYLYKDATIFLDRKQVEFFSISPPEFSSKFRGVSFDKRRKKWRCRFQYKYREVYIGHFDSENAAAEAFDTAAKKLGYPRYKLNFCSG